MSSDSPPYATVDNVLDAGRRRALDAVWGLIRDDDTELTTWSDAVGVIELVLDAVGYDRLRNENGHLLAALNEVLSTFTVRGHPGRPCLRTSWQTVEQVERWRKEATS